MKNLFEDIKHKLYPFILYWLVKSKLKVGQMYKRKYAYYFITSVNSEYVSIVMWNKLYFETLTIPFIFFIDHFYSTNELIDEIEL